MKRFISGNRIREIQHLNICNECTSLKELKVRLDAIGSILAFICSQASKTAAPYISELAEAAVGDALGT